MYLAEQLKRSDDRRLRLAAQLGVTAIIGDARPAAQLIGDDGRWTGTKVAAERRRIAAYGLQLEALALDPQSILLDSLYDRTRADAHAERLRTDICAAADGGVAMLKYNLQMYGIARTGMAYGRGGAQVSRFRAADYAPGRRAQTYWSVAERSGAIMPDEAARSELAAVEGPSGRHRPVSEAQGWDAAAYLVEQLLPTAERAGVRLAVHPQDPALPPGGLDGVEHVVGSIAGIRRFLALGGESANHGLNFCQGTIGAMGADPNATVQQAIAEFGGAGRIFMVHFRNIGGGYLDFQEAFPDAGRIDMAQAIRNYRAAGYDGPLCPDHVPLSDVDPDRERFFAFALGHMRGLLQATA